MNDWKSLLALVCVFVSIAVIYINYRRTNAFQRGCDQASDGEIMFFDRKWTVEAIGNIVDNAIKYTQTGRITIEASEFELFTRIHITDTGIGIEEAEQPKVALLFPYFFRDRLKSYKSVRIEGALERL